MKKVRSYSLPLATFIKYGDFTLKIKPRYDNIQKDLFLGRKHENHVRLFLEKNIKPGTVYFDIGAHIGIFVLTASKLVGKNGRCVAFEPCSMLADLLTHNLYMNGIHNVKVIRKAVSNKNDNIMFYQNRDLAMNSVVYFPSYNKSKVPSVSLDAFCLKENIVPDFIKIDAEGAEVLIFKDMQNLFKSQKKPIILCELHPAVIKTIGEDIFSTIEMFKRYRYKIYVLDNFGEMIPFSERDVLLRPTAHIVAMPEII